MIELDKILIPSQEENGTWTEKSLKDCNWMQFLNWAIWRLVEIGALFPWDAYPLRSQADFDELKRAFVDFLRAHGEEI